MTGPSDDQRPALRDDAWRAATFDAERGRLTGLAYRLLGSLTDAEDVVQEAWIRWSRADVAAVERPAAWLTTTVGRLGLDRLRARRRERVDYVGPWLPEPFVQPLDGPRNTGGPADPADVAELADSLTTAFLVLLERLSPEERLVVLLADVFAEPFGSVAATVGRTPDATRQLAVRARRKLRAGPQPPVRPRPAEELAVAAAFAAAVMAGDVDAVHALLHPDTVLTSDGGQHRRAARRPVVGPDRVARFVVNVLRRLPEGGDVEPVLVNGAPGMLVSVDGRPFLVHALEVRDGRVARQYLVLNPDKLAAVGRGVGLS